ncbi:MAG: lipocalin family protein [Gemmataceae bacterium]
MFTRAAALAVGLIALSAVAPADDTKDDPKSDEKLLVGRWKLAKLNGDDLPAGAEIVLEVQKGGKFKLTATQGLEKDVNTGTWKLAEKKITLEFTDGSRTGTKQTDTVKELMEKKLVLLDRGETPEEYERVAEKKSGR